MQRRGLSRRQAAALACLACLACCCSATVLRGQRTREEQPPRSAPRRQLRWSAVLLPPVPKLLLPPVPKLPLPLPLLPTAAAAAAAAVPRPLSGLLNSIEAGLPNLELLSSAGRPEVEAPSSATASGFAFNGGKSSAHATSNAQSRGSPAVSNATAISNRVSVSLADASALSSSKGANASAGSAASTRAEAVSDRDAIAVARGGAFSVGLGGERTTSDVSSSSAATRGGASLVGGTAVSSATPGSSAHTAASATGAAQQHGVAATRADSISVGAAGSAATGSTSSAAQSSGLGSIAASHSLMESFAIGRGDTQASSEVGAGAANGGVSLQRDKAVAIGLDGASASTNTTTRGSADRLGLSVVDAVARAITAGNQRACADAVTKTYSDLSTGPQVDLSTFILTLKQRADSSCVQVFKDQASRALAGSAAALPTFEGISAEVSDATQDVVHTTRAALAKFLEALPKDQEPGEVVEQTRGVTWGSLAQLLKKP